MVLGKQGRFFQFSSPFCSAGGGKTRRFREKKCWKKEFSGVKSEKAPFFALSMKKVCYHHHLHS